mmetsp:Transcript_115635/g.334051  ORF Transcript_115635/g.334051 Transcript_115635/m.334051 type:complete len:120 (-) Transcript_115635:51-410(-)
MISEDGQEVAQGTHILKIRNNVLVNSDGDLEDLVLFGSAEAYNPIEGDSVGVTVVDIINEPEMYGGIEVPVKGWDGSEFDNAEVQEAYMDYLNDDSESKDTTRLMAVYLETYYPDLPRL